MDRDERLDALSKDIRKYVPTMKKHSPGVLAGFVDDLLDRVNRDKSIVTCTCSACAFTRMYVRHKIAVGGATKTSWVCMCHNCVSDDVGLDKAIIPNTACTCAFCEAEKENTDQTRPFDLEGINNLPTVEELLADDLKHQETQEKETETMMQKTGETESAIIRNREKVDIGGKEPPRFETKGTQIILPEGMSPLEGAEWLLKREKELEQVVTVSEQIEGFPLEAMIAFDAALDKIFGWKEMTALGWFPPDTISVQTGLNTFKSVPWGGIRMPGIDGEIFPCAAHTSSNGKQCLTIHGNVKKKHREKIAEVAQLARQLLRETSIYKGKAIKIEFPEDDLDEHEKISAQHMPSFFDTSGVNPEEVVFSKSVESQIKISLFTPIRNVEACRKHKIPLKRTILFAGTYGVGKTLTAAVTAQEAEKHGWTFILPHSADDLAKTVEFAQQYEPAVIFVEDIDRVMDGERTIDMDEVLNIIDGIESKGRELMIILTTNHPDRINKAMLRPGRVDALIEVTPPDSEAAQRLVRVYARELLAQDQDLSEVGKLLAGHKPASIREVVERAKLAAIGSRGDGATTITSEDLLMAAEIMKPHFTLMEEKKTKEQVSLETIFKELVSQAIATNGTSITSPAPTSRQLRA